MMGFGWALGGLGMIFMMFFWLIVVVLAIWLLSRLFPGATSSTGAATGQASSTDSAQALDLLKQRYARGEISKEQYEDMRHTLQV
jgi:putative membrane protein